MLQEECKEKILSEEYRDFMMRDTGALGKNFPLENGCRIPLKYGFELFYIDQSEDRKKSLADYPYTMVPKCYTTLDMAAIQQAGIAAVQNIPGLELSGEGVLVGIIDTGINYLDPIFRNLDGSTRIQRIWDQEEQSGTAPRGIGSSRPSVADRCRRGTAYWRRANPAPAASAASGKKGRRWQIQTRRGFCHRRKGERQRKNVCRCQVLHRRR